MSNEVLEYRLVIETRELISTMYPWRARLFYGTEEISSSIFMVRWLWLPRWAKHQARKHKRRIRRARHRMERIIRV
jgi:hypothetical protein